MYPFFHNEKKWSCVLLSHLKYAFPIQCHQLLYTVINSVARYIHVNYKYNETHSVVNSVNSVVIYCNIKFLQLQYV